jgi:hypothetical protein
MLLRREERLMCKLVGTGSAQRLVTEPRGDVLKQPLVWAVSRSRCH